MGELEAVRYSSSEDHLHCDVPCHVITVRHLVDRSIALDGVHL